MLKPTPTTMLTGQFIAQLSVIPMIIYATGWQWIVCAIMYFGIMTFGITMGYHRYWSHRYFTCSKFWEYIMLFFAHIMMVGPAIAWVAQHIEHHKFVDSPRDPHSPAHKGYLYCYFLQSLQPPKIKYAHHLLRDRTCKIQFDYYWEFLIVWGVILVVLDPFALIYAWLAPAGLAKIIGSFIFTYGHHSGRPHNNTLLGLLTSGEGFHQVHHQHEDRVQWDKLDIGGQIIRRIGNVT